ncbi:hypothetical protein ACLOJK_039950 [Asimina triloba]
MRRGGSGEELMGFIQGSGGSGGRWVRGAQVWRKGQAGDDVAGTRASNLSHILSFAWDEMGWDGIMGVGEWIKFRWTEVSLVLDGISSGV